MEGAPAVSTAGWARNITGFALTLLTCVLGAMLNSLKEYLKSNRLRVFCFKFHWQKTPNGYSWMVVASSLAEPSNRHNLLLKCEEPFQRVVQLWVLWCYCTVVILFCFSLQIRGGSVCEKFHQTTEKFSV